MTIRDVSSDRIMCSIRIDSYSYSYFKERCFRGLLITGYLFLYEAHKYAGYYLASSLNRVIVVMFTALEGIISLEK